MKKVIELIAEKEGRSSKGGNVRREGGNISIKGKEKGRG